MAVGFTGLRRFAREVKGFPALRRREQGIGPAVKLVPIFEIASIHVVPQLVQLPQDVLPLAEARGSQAVKQLQLGKVDLPFLGATHHERVVGLTPSSTAATEDRSNAVADRPTGKRDKCRQPLRSTMARENRAKIGWITSRFAARVLSRIRGDVPR